MDKDELNEIADTIVTNQAKVKDMVVNTLKEIKPIKEVRGIKEARKDYIQAYAEFNQKQNKLIQKIINLRNLK